MFLKIKNGNVELKHNPKYIHFEDDNFIYDTENFTVISEGYYLGETPNYDSILNLKYDEFINKYKGSFVVVKYNKSNKNISIYNDLLSKKYIYYFSSDNLTMCSTSYFEILSELKAEDIKLSIDDDGVKDMLVRGSFTDNRTYTKEIKFLRAFEYICIDDEFNVNKLEYPKPISTISMNEARDKAYKLFQDGVKLAINKNEQFKRDHIASLSGGMDTRAVFLQLIQNNIKNIVTYTYAQSNSMDEIISKQIAKDYKVKNIFYPLDNAEFILDRDKLISQNEGQMYYCGSTGMYNCLQMVDTSKSGLIYMGIGGGEILGDILKVEYEEPYKDFPKKSYMINLDDIRQCQNSVLTAAKYSDYFSPFLYEDFFTYVMRLPFEIKQRRALYVEIFNEFMYNSYDTTMFKGKIGNKRSFISRVYNYAKLKILKKDKYSMNPMDYWYNTNNTIQNYIISTFNNDIEILESLNYNTQMLKNNFSGDTLAKLRTLTASYMILKTLGE